MIIAWVTSRRQELFTTLILQYFCINLRRYTRGVRTQYQWQQPPSMIDTMSTYRRLCRQPCIAGLYS